MKSLKALLIPIISLYIMSCDRLDGIDEGDRNTYTWKGTLYQGVSDTPLPNSDIYLEATYRGTPDDKYEVIAETKTDENGDFILTYRKLRKLNASSVTLFQSTSGYTNNLLLNGPVNENVYRDVAEKNHQRVLAEFQSNTKTKVDSLYMAIPFMIDNASEISRIQIQGTGNSYNVAVLTDVTLPFSFEMKSELGGDWNNTGEEFVLAYGLNRKEFQAAFTAPLNEEIPQDSNRASYNARGFPYQDHVTIIIK